MVSINQMVPYGLMYSQKHGSNLPYSGTAPAWYPNYPTHHGPHHPNNHLLNPTPTSIGSGLDSDSAAAFYQSHHHMLHSSSPDWGHDSYNLTTQNSQFPFANGMTPPSSLHLSPTINSHHSANNSANGNGDNLPNGLQNIPPSPPITVNSACSEMSSPGIGSNGNGVGIGNGDASPSMTSNNNLSRSKSPQYDWMKKQSYQNTPNAGMCNSIEPRFILFREKKNKLYFIQKGENDH